MTVEAVVVVAPPWLVVVAGLNVAMMAAQLSLVGTLNVAEVVVPVAMSGHNHLPRCQRWQRGRFGGSEPVVGTYDLQVARYLRQLPSPPSPILSLLRHALRNS